MGASVTSESYFHALFAPQTARAGTLISECYAGFRGIRRNLRPRTPAYELRRYDGSLAAPGSGISVRLSQSLSFVRDAMHIGGYFLATLASPAV